MSVPTVRPGTVRERRNAETLREIKEAALGQLVENGAGKLSLRGVARDVGMTVQSLYHYVDSYDALVSLLVVDSHESLAAAVSRSAEEATGRPWPDRLEAAVLAYRRWALEHRAQFLLIYGTPIPGYVAPGESRLAALRLGAVFAEVVYQGWSADDLQRVPLLGEDPRTGSGPEPPEGLADSFFATLPPGAFAYFLQMRSTLHGLVLLELLGQLGPVSGEQLAVDFVRRTVGALEQVRHRPA